MTAVLAFLRLCWKPLTVLAIALAVWWAIRHYGDARYAAGYAQARTERMVAEAQAFVKWQADYNARVKADEERLAAAHRGYEQELALAAAAARRNPQPRLVCHAADTSRRADVPAATGLPKPQAPDSGVLPREDAESFDPAPAALDIASEADYLLAGCRMLNQAVHGVPTR